MKNILVTIFSFLLVVLIVVLMIKGIKIGNIEILSISQIISKSDELTQNINKVNNLKSVTYKNTLASLNDSTKQLASAKSDYLEIATESSQDEIEKANQIQVYSMEYLWSQVGNHATDKGVNLKMEVSSTGVGNKNKLNFTVTGSYIAIRNFVYALENDSDLNFRIENFKIVTGTTAENLVSTFTVSDIGIKAETTSTIIEDKSNKGSEQKNQTTTQDANKFKGDTALLNTTDVASDKIQNAIK